MRFHVLPFLALAGAAVAQSSASEEEIPGEYIDAAVSAYATIPGMAGVASVYSKYRTASGFSSVQSEIVEEVATYAVTQTHIVEEPTATDLASLATDPAVVAIAEDVVSIVTKYMATETYMNKAVKSSLVADVTSVIGAFENSAAPTATGSADASGSGTGPLQTQDANAGAAGVRAGVMGVVAAVAAVALIV